MMFSGKKFMIVACGPRVDVLTIDRRKTYYRVDL